MGNIVRGHTICPICNKIMEVGEEIVLFPYFADDEMEFAILNDGAVHKSCFLNYTLRFQVRDYVYGLIIDPEYSHPLWTSLLMDIEELLENADL